MNKGKLKGGCFSNIPPNSPPNTPPNTNLQENEEHDSGMQFIKRGIRNRVGGVRGDVGGGVRGGSLANTHHVRLPISKGLAAKRGECRGVFANFLSENRHITGL